MTQTSFGKPRIQGYLDNGKLTPVDPTLWPQAGKNVYPVGQATQIGTKLNQTAGFFNGTTDYIDFTDSIDYAAGTGPFTAECFVNITSGIGSASEVIMDFRNGDSTSSGWMLYMTGSVMTLMSSGGTNVITSARTLVHNTWYHVMVVGNGAGSGSRNVKLYLDGTQTGSTWTTDYNFTDQKLRLGAKKSDSLLLLFGWMKEFRWSKVERTVAVPTSQYTPDADTKVLLHFDQTATYPLAPAISFDGSGDYLQLPASADWAFGAAGSGDFTMEAFVNIYKLGVDGTVHGLFSVGTAGGPGWGFYYYQDLDASAGVGLYSQTAVTSYAYHKRFVQGKWTHVAIVRTGSNIYLFLDGQRVGTTFTDGAFTNSTDPFYIGKYNAVSSFSHMREIRVSNIARYSASFTPSQNGFVVDSNTKLYIKGNGSNGKTSVPIMTSNTAPSGVASEQGGSANFWNVFNGNDLTEQWFSGLGGAVPATWWMKYQFASPTIIKSYGFKSCTDYRYTMTGWKFQGSNNNTDWTDLDTQSGISWGNLDRKVWSINNSTAYTYYRVANTSGQYLDGVFLSQWYMSADNAIVDSESTPKQVFLTGDTTISYNEDYRSSIVLDSASSFSNTGLEKWSNGTSFVNPATQTQTADDVWALCDGTSNTTITREATEIHGGTYSLKGVTTTLGGGTYFLLKFVPGVASGWTALPTGTSVTFTAWVKANAAVGIRIGALGFNYNTTYHTGGDTWEQLTVTATTTKSEVYFYFIALAGSTYYIDDITITPNCPRTFPAPKGATKVDFIVPFGTGAALCDGPGNMVIAPDSPDWGFDGDFTMEGYGRLNSLASDYATMFATYYAANTGMIWYMRPPYLDSNGIVIYPNTGGAAYYWYPINQFVFVNSWFHFAISRVGGNIRMFINGNLIKYNNTAYFLNYATTTERGAAGMGIGGGPTAYAWANYCWRGMLDNMKISKGIGRYVSSFNPPSTTPTGDSQDKLLLTYEKPDMWRGTGIATPIMTSNTTPSGVASASSEFGVNYEAFRAFDDTGSNWLSNVAPETTPQWLKYDFGVGVTKTITSFNLRYRQAVGDPSNPKDFIFQGSNDNTNWTNLLTVTGETTGWPEGSRAYKLSNGVAFRYYRLYITARNGGNAYVALMSMEMYEGTAPNLFLDTEYITQATPPTTDTLTSQFSRLQVLMRENANSGQTFNPAVVSTYSLTYAAVQLYAGAVLSPTGDIHLIPYNGALYGQKINPTTGISTTYAILNAAPSAYLGGVLASNGDIHFVPANGATMGQKVSVSGIVSTYTLAYTMAGYAYFGGVCALNGDVHFVPYSASVGQKVSALGTVSTYPLVFTNGSAAYIGGCVAPNGDIHFAPYTATVGQKISSTGVVSTYSLIYTTGPKYTGAVLSPNGDIHFIPYSAQVGQKISSSGVVSTYAILATGYYGGCLAPNGDIHFIPYLATVGQKVSASGVVSTYSIPQSGYLGGVLAPNGDIHIVPYTSSPAVMMKISTNSDVPIGIGLCTSPWLNKW